MERSLKDPDLVVKEFLDRHWDRSSPLLIAYSGGFDSKTLLHAAVSWNKVPLHVAHVDHGWREESASEALALQQEADLLGLPFHTVRLPRKMSEEEAREARLDYFHSLRETVPYQAILMAHQADDLAETVLKRVLEGAALLRLKGMSSVSQMVWRPLLSVRRRAIEEWLQRRGLIPILDPTNADPRYLRARMRQELLPLLERSFGKQCRQNLVKLSVRSCELEQYFAKKIQALQHRLMRGPFGTCLDARGLERIEARELIQTMIPVPHELMERLLDWLFEGKANAAASIGQNRLIVDRGRLFLLSRAMPAFDEPLQVGETPRASGSWRFEVAEHEELVVGWEALWKGFVCIPCPEGIVSVAAVSPKPPRGGKTPAFLRKICPTLVCDKGGVQEIFTEKKAGSTRVIKIFINAQPVGG